MDIGQSSRTSSGGLSRDELRLRRGPRRLPGADHRPARELRRGRRAALALRGYPGSDRPRALRHWLKRHSRRPNYSVAGYEPRSAEEIQTWSRSVKASPGGWMWACERRRTGRRGPGQRPLPVPRLRLRRLPALRRPAVAEDAVRLLGRLTEEEITFGGPSKATTHSHVNVAFTHAGSGAAGAQERADGVPRRVPRRGPCPRRRDLGHVAGRGLHGRAPAALRTRSLADGPRLGSSTSTAATRRLRPLPLVEHQEAALLECGQREHFGFADGRSQPAIAGVDPDPTGDGIYATTAGEPCRAGADGARCARSAAALAAPRTGEFLLGYDNEDGEPPGARARRSAPTARSWSTARWFSTSTSSTASSTRRRRRRIDRDVLRAKILGRWPDGTPLASSPVEDPMISSDRRRSNEFLYSTTRTAPAARSGRTSGARTRATGCPAGASARCATGSSVADAVRRRRRAGPDLHLPGREHSQRLRVHPAQLARQRRGARSRGRPRLPARARRLGGGC